MKPKCSVIIPSYNNKEFLRISVKSVQEQTFSNFELIIIDDCSEDGSFEMLMELAEKDPRLKVFRNHKNEGVAKTRNRGIEFSQGEYLALLDSDDIWLPDKLERQIDFLESSGGSLTYCSYGFMDRLGTPIPYIFKIPPKVDKNMLLIKNVISCSTVLGERELFLRHPFHSEYYHEDFIAWLDMIEEKKCFYGQVQELAKIRIRKGSRSGDKKNSARHRWNIYREYLGFNRLRSTFYFSLYAFFSIIKYRKIRKELAH